MIYIHERDVFGKLFRGFSLDISEEIDKEFLISNRINSLVLTRSANQEKEDMAMLAEIPLLEGLSFPDPYYPTLNVLKQLSNILYLNIKGKVGAPIPFESLPRLWCVYLNYDKKTCGSIFKAQSLEYLFIDNYKGSSSEDFVPLSKIKRLGLIKFGLNEFDAIEHMPYIEHLGMGYNPKMMDISWIAQAQSLKSVSFTNCKNITNWQVLGSLTNLETIIIENAGEIPSIDFLSHLPNLRKVGLIGKMDIKEKSPIEDNQSPDKSYITSIDDIENIILKIILEKSDTSKYMNIGEIGNSILKRYSDFDVRNYGYYKLSTFLSNLPSIGIVKKENSVKAYIKENNEIRDIIYTILEDNESKSVDMGRLSQLLLEKIPQFDVKNYGYNKFSKFISSFDEFEIKSSGQRNCIKNVSIKVAR